MPLCIISSPFLPPSTVPSSCCLGHLVLCCTEIGQSDKVAYADDLPDEAEDQVRLSGLQVLRPDVDNVAADRLRRVDSQREVLVYLIDVQFAAVQRPLVDCTRLRTVHHLTVMTHLHGDRLVASITFVKKVVSCNRLHPV